MSFGELATNGENGPMACAPIYYTHERCKILMFVFPDAAVMGGQRSVYILGIRFIYY